MRITAWLSLVLVAAAATRAWAGALPVTLVSITQPVHPGGAVTLVIQTKPGVVCGGARQGHFGNDYSIPLQPRTTGPDGRAEWQWSVLSGRHPIGLRGVHVTCSARGQSGRLETRFDVE